MSRRLLQEADVDTFDGISNNISTSPSSASAPTPAPWRRPFTPSTPFDSSMALTILVLLTALFFMGFFSIYIRRFTNSNDASPSSTPRPTPPKRGLDPSAVGSLPLVAYGKAAKHPMIDDCPICLSEFNDKETVKLIPYCSHVFHPKCIDTWLSSHVTCPLCRSAQLFKGVEEVRLDVTRDKVGNPGIEDGEGSTVVRGDTWREERRGGVRIEEG